jgi:hypothetical protein
MDTGPKNKSMTYRRFWINGFLFLFFLIPGLWIGHSIGEGRETRGEDLNLIKGFPDTTNSKQQNLLIIGVDNLSSSKARLESLWLAMYFPGRSDVAFIPLLPGYIEQTAFVDPDLAQSFSLQSNGSPGKSFFNELGKSLWWDHFILFDRNSMSEWIDFLGGVYFQNRYQDGASVVSSLPKIDRDIENALYAHAELISAVCLQISSHPLPKETSDYLARVENHYRSDADLRGLFQDWMSVRATSELPLVCEFPTLDPVRP